MIAIIFSVLAVVFTIAAFLFYYSDLRRAKVSPNRISWIIWSLTTTLETISYIAVSHDLVKALYFIISSICSIAITIKIWTHSHWTKPNYGEVVSVIFCFASIAIWIIFNSEWFAHVLLLIALPIAFLPTFRNGLKDYRNENSYAWILWAISDIFGITVIALRIRTYEELPYAILELFCHLGVCAIIYLNRKRFLKGYFLDENRHGHGVYARKKYRNSEIILKFAGSVIHKDNIPVELKGNDDHYLQIDIDWYLGPSGNEDDFINHSCNPNAGIVFLPDGIYLKAIEVIEKTREITFDYSTTIYQSSWKMDCDCNNPKCRKVISDFCSLGEFLRNKYIGLGIIAPYILKQIHGPVEVKINSPYIGELCPPTGNRELHTIPPHGYNINF